MNLSSEAFVFRQKVDATLALELKKQLPKLLETTTKHLVRELYPNMYKDAYQSCCESNYEQKCKYIVMTFVKEVKRFHNSPYIWTGGLKDIITRHKNAIEDLEKRVNECEDIITDCTNRINFLDTLSNQIRGLLDD
jgi:uncharacterized Zn finger protein